jgi:membrane-bound lytic murein transglycosylase
MKTNQREKRELTIHRHWQQWAYKTRDEDMKTNQRGKRELTIHRHWQQWAYKTRDEDMKTNQRGKRELTIHRHWQQWAHKTRDEDIKTQTHYTVSYKDEHHGPLQKAWGELWCLRRVNSTCFL